jgi:hypothetical protein
MCCDNQRHIPVAEAGPARANTTKKAPMQAKRIIMALLVVLSARAPLNIVPLLCSDPSWDGEPEKKPATVGRIGGDEWA